MARSMQSESETTTLRKELIAR